MTSWRFIAIPESPTKACNTAGDRWIAATERGPHPNCNYLRMAFESSWLTGAFSEAFKNPFTVSWDPCSILNLPVDWQIEYYCLETSRHSTNDVSMIRMPIWRENEQMFNYTLEVQDQTKTPVFGMIHGFRIPYYQWAKFGLWTYRVYYPGGFKYCLFSPLPGEMIQFD